ncbi:MAG: hypothetical protein K9N51_06600 [Candidatus Pacebacteria bacterium]|nr:hypothetical protein [Candidatus Paceibacterota bacterium]
MNKRLIYAFIIIGLAIIVMLFNSDKSVDVNLLVKKIEMLKSLVFLAFMAIGVAVGVLVK